MLRRHAFFLLPIAVLLAAPGMGQAEDSGQNRRLTADFLGEGDTDRLSFSELRGLIISQIEPHWTPRRGALDTALSTTVSFELGSDGNLAAQPSIVRQSGAGEAGQEAADLHGADAIRAVELAAPFDLPADDYPVWKSVTITFDWKLSR